MRRVIVDNKRNIVDEAGAGRLPQEGRDLALSIDRKLQHLVFRELKDAVELNKARAGGAVVLDVHTGEILALANWPAFDPNKRDVVPRDCHPPVAPRHRSRRPCSSGGANHQGGVTSEQP